MTGIGYGRALALAAFTMMLPAATRAQGVAPPAACGRVERPSAPSASRRDQARRLAVQAHESAIVGDHDTARARFRVAAQLDPSNDNIAYQYARALEDAGERSAAVREYCRVLAITPAGGDAADARAAITRLAPAVAAAPSASRPRSTASSDAGERAAARPRAREVAAGTKNDVASAATDSATSRTATSAGPSAAGPTAGGATTGAATTSGATRDAAPGGASSGNTTAPSSDQAGAPRGTAPTTLGARPAPPPPPVAPETPARTSSASRSVWVPQPSSALVRGLIVPGLGQFYTRRPLIGAIVAAGVIGSAVWAFSPGDETVSRTFTDPFGFEHTYTAVQRGRPHMTAGLAMAGALGVGSAIEAYLYARRAQQAHSSVSLRVVPASGDGRLALGVGIRVPAN